MTNYNVVIYRPCYYKVSDINANTPEEAIEKVERHVSEYGLASSIMDYVETDDDFEPTRITVTDADAEEYTEVLVKGTPDVQTLKNLLSVPQTESEYTRLVDVIALSLFEAVNDNPESPLCPLLAFVCGLISVYEGRPYTPAKFEEEGKP